MFAEWLMDNHVDVEEALRAQAELTEDGQQYLVYLMAHGSKSFGDAISHVKKLTPTQLRIGLLTGNANAGARPFIDTAAAKTDAPLESLHRGYADSLNAPQYLVGGLGNSPTQEPGLFYVRLGVRTRLFKLEQTEFVPRDTEDAIAFVISMLMTSIYFVHSEHGNLRGAINETTYMSAYTGKEWEKTYTFTSDLKTLNDRLKLFNTAKASAHVHMATLVAIWVNMQLLTKAKQEKQAFFIALIWAAHRAYCFAKKEYILKNPNPPDFPGYPYALDEHTMNRSIDNDVEIICRFYSLDEMSIDLQGSNPRREINGILIKNDRNTRTLKVYETPETIAYDMGYTWQTEGNPPKVSVEYSATGDTVATLQTKLRHAIGDTTFSTQTMTDDYFMWAVFCGSMQGHYLLG